MPGAAAAPRPPRTWCSLHRQKTAPVPPKREPKALTRDASLVPVPCKRVWDGRSGAVSPVQGPEFRPWHLGGRIRWVQGALKPGGLKW
jgi:hypothetical protein